VSIFCWRHRGGGQTKENALSIEDQNVNAQGTGLLGALGNTKASAKQGMGGIEDGYLFIVNAP
jgi:hypothetical protein